MGREMGSQKPSRWQGSLLPLLVGIGLIGCGRTGDLIALSNSSAISISELQQHQKESEVVYLKGIVGDRVPFLGSGAYQLQDRTGAVWVMTQKELPSQGDEIAIKGQIKHEPIAIGEQESQEMYVVELEKLERRSQSRSRQPAGTPPSTDK